MSTIKRCPFCYVPEICLMACPHNRILDQMRHPVCDLGSEIVADADENVEIVFDEAARFLPA